MRCVFTSLFSAFALLLSASPARAADSPADDGSATGWGVAGVHLGLLAGAAGTYGLYRALSHAGHWGDDRYRGEPVTPIAMFFGSMVLVVGTPTGAGLGTAALARHGHWDRAVGWGATGAMLGSLAGGALGLSSLYAAEDAPSAGAAWGWGLGGAVAGGALSSFLFSRWARDDGNMAGEVLGAYAGALVGWSAGIGLTVARYSDEEKFRQHLFIAAIPTALGAFAGMFVGHFVQPRKPLPTTMAASASLSRENLGFTFSGRF